MAESAVEDVHREALAALKSYKLSARAWSLIGAPCFEKRPSEGAVWSADEILDRTIYQQHDLKLPQEIPHHLRIMTQHTIQHALQNFIQTIQSDTPLRPHIDSKTIRDSSCGDVRCTEVDVIEPDLQSDDEDGDVTGSAQERANTTRMRRLIASSADLAQLREIQHHCEAFMRGTRVSRESLSEPTPFVRGVLHRHTHH